MTASIFHGDSRDVLRLFPDSTFDAIVTDPPYELTSTKRTKPAPVVEGSPFSRHRVGVNGDNKPVGGFMGKEWDGTGVAFDPKLWAEVLRVLKPGGHVLAFGGTRTYHRMACAIEDGGFEIRDQLGWVYGSGFPKSRDLAAMDMGGQDAATWEGWGTALKPAWEPIVLARKPIARGLNVAGNLIAHGTGALNIDGCRVPSSESLGRWPANLIHDGSDEVLAAFPQAPGQLARASTSDTQRAGQNVYGAMTRGSGASEPRVGLNKSAARFFYCAKASTSERGEGNSHPTVKPLTLMRHLCRLITPPGGCVLDPFTGSGTTGVAAHAEGFLFVGVEREADYVAIASRRLGL
jgi:site-specific DNA-methyltransferase (adenine-specific)